MTERMNVLHERDASPIADHGFFFAKGRDEAVEPVARKTASGSRNLSAKILIANTEDIVRARQTGRLLVQELGFSDNQSIIVITVISELARNIVLYANAGEITITAKL